MRQAIRYLPLLILLAAVFSQGCRKEWDDHFLPAEETLNLPMMDQVRENPSFSTFVEYLELNQLDTLFEGNQQYTLFLPNNQAFENLPDSIEIDAFIMNHMISANVINVRNVDQFRKLQTLSGKFAFIENSGGAFKFDGSRIISSSPLYLDGRFFELDEVPLAKPNFYEYFQVRLNVMQVYVDAQDSTYLDKTLSAPIGFNEAGEIVYDSVFTTKNLFESYIFPVSQESRDEFATFVLFTEDQYEEALDEMAQSIGGAFQSHEDIPLAWQEAVLLPSVIENGVFSDILTIEQLSDPNLLNINGEFTNLDVPNIDSSSQFLCSNGVMYHFLDFSVNEELYLGENRIEGESLIDSIGQGKYAWKEDVTVRGANVEPIESKTDLASEGSMVTVVLGRNFSDSYSVEFNFHNVFPGRHRLEWRANYRPSAIYAVYVNDEQVGQFDTYNLRYSIPSVTGERFTPEDGFNRVDFLVENLVEYGDVTVRFEFLDKGISADNGFNIDYVSMIPFADN